MKSLESTLEVWLPLLDITLFLYYYYYFLILNLFIWCSAEEMGFLICFSMEHNCLADAYELLCQDSEFNCTKVSEETAGKSVSCINKQVSGN